VRKPPRNTHCGNAALTLLELLVVITITGILAAFLMPVLNHAKQRSYAAKSSSNLRQLVMANLAYLSDRGCYVPAANKANNKRWCGARTGTQQAFDPTGGYLADYLGKTRSVTADPLFTEMLKASNSFEEGAGGYGYNEWYIGGTPVQAYHSDGSLRSATLGQVSRPASTVMFATTAYARAGGVQEYPFAEPPFWDFGDGPSDFRPSPSVHFRFAGKAIIGWCDGHISMEAREDRPEGDNPHGGDAAKEDLGWFGPDKDNGYWNPNR
jgi:prepilin-type N-terminal cleavage/methylation domain-containing protein/prepilin-type processing-associated H-X9-DG protein